MQNWWFRLLFGDRVLLLCGLAWAVVAFVLVFVTLLQGILTKASITSLNKNRRVLVVLSTGRL